MATIAADGARPQIVTFLLRCPNCGPRAVEDFTTTGEVTVRPQAAPSRRELSRYIYFKTNAAGIQREWWYHRHGCQVWFLADRDTRTNEVLNTELPPAARSGAR